MKYKGCGVNKRLAYGFFHDAKLDSFCGSLSVLCDNHVHVPTFDGGRQVMVNDNDEIEVAPFSVKASHYRGTVEIYADETAA